MKKFLALLTVLIYFASCADKDNEQTTQAVCDTTNSEFKQVYTAFSSAPTAHAEVTMDTEVHSYTFFVSSPKTICSIGYQSAHADPTVPYLIEIVNNVTSAVVYSGSHIFSTTATSYVSLTTTVNLQANISYTIRRIQTNWGTDIGNTIGRLSWSYDSSGDVDLLPLTSGDLTITSAYFDAFGMGQLYNMLPYIDIVFES